MGAVREGEGVVYEITGRKDALLGRVHDDIAASDAAPGMKDRIVRFPCRSVRLSVKVTVGSTRSKSDTRFPRCEAPPAKKSRPQRMTPSESALELGRKGRV
jgi:hypothetical protein